MPGPIPAGFLRNPFIGSGDGPLPYYLLNPAYGKLVSLARFGNSVFDRNCVHAVDYNHVNRNVRDLIEPQPELVTEGDEQIMSAIPSCLGRSSML